MLLRDVVETSRQVSPRYESGIALRFARVKRYRTDKTAEEADAFDTVKKLAAFQNGTDNSR